MKKIKTPKTNTDNNFYNLKGKNAEKMVQRLAIKTFLTDWCYLNPRLPDNKELCDLLVVFNEIAIIWQIKDLKLNKLGKYSEAEVQKNLRQLSGARRQLFDLKTSVELENPYRGKEKFDPTTIKGIYLISVLLGEGEEMFSFFEEIKNHKVHVFNKKFTQIILDELDTISDFIDYLHEKENFLEKGKSLVILGGEEELLAFYLINNRNFKRFEKADHITIEEGSWKHLQKKPEYKRKKKADKISYYWDSVINRAHEGSSNEYKKIARELARHNRVQRRFLSKIFFEAYVLAHKDTVHDSYRRILLTENYSTGVTYCFLFLDDPEPRERRRAMLGAMCLIARGKHQQNKKVIGIATEKKIRPENSYDFCLMDIPEWTEDNQKSMEKLQRKTKIFNNLKVSHMREEEYPKIDQDK